MSSSSLLPSKYFDKLQVNRLKANNIKSDNIIPTSPSYLFSAVFNNAIFDRNNTGGTLTITKDDTESIIQFSDRPFRQTENINFDTFVSLFDTRGNDSFEEDPPNGVLTHNEEQRTYIIRLLNSNTDSAIFSLELLPGESHNLNRLSGRMNLFVDDGDQTTSNSIILTPTSRATNPQHELNTPYTSIIQLTDVNESLTFNETTLTVENVIGYVYVQNLINSNYYNLDTTSNLYNSLKSNQDIYTVYQSSPPNNLNYLFVPTG